MRLVTFGGFAALGLAVLAAACSEPIPSDMGDEGAGDEGEARGAKLPPRSNNEEGDEDEPMPAERGDGGPSSPAPSDGGTPEGGTAKDGGAGGGGGAANAFTGAPPFVKQTGPSTVAPIHGIGGNPAKKACLGCHGNNGPGPRWFAAGTVYKDKAATIPAASVEVRLRDVNGNAVTAHTDLLGNFFVPYAQGANMKPPILAGARDGTTTRLMGIVDPSGNCNQTSCHGGAQGFVSLQ